MELFPHGIDDKKAAQKAKDYHQQFTNYFDSGDYINARKATEQLILDAKRDNYLPGIVLSYINSSRIESYFQQFGDSIDNLLKALEISKMIDNNFVKSNVNENLGICYAQSGNLDKGLQYLMKSLEYYPESSHALTNAGFIYIKQENYEKAMEYTNKAIKLHSKNRNMTSKAYAVYNLGEIFLNNGDLHKADKQYDEVLFIGQKYKNLHLIGMAFLGKAQLLKKKMKYVIALEKLSLALDFAQQDDDSYLTEQCYSLYSEIYKITGDYKEALYFTEQKQNEKEKLFNAETQQEIKKLQEKYNFEMSDQKQKESVLLASNEKIIEKFQHLQSAYAEVTGIGEIGLFSPLMQDIVSIAERFHTDRTVPVLIEGETGTGKEIIARIIHHGKGNKANPFIVLNCAAVSPTLFESELFGYEEGSFTGAKKQGSAGKFEIAQGGTLFLDEIGDLPLELQPKLLRALQQKEIYRIGGNKPIQLDVRVICATNRNLQRKIDEGEFRRDLFYRLNTGRIFIPPLSARKEEIVSLVQMFLIRFSKDKNKHFKGISLDAKKVLESYNWKGNVRELENCIERIVLLNDEEILQPHHLHFLEFDKTEDQKLNYKYLHLTFPDEGLSFGEINKTVIKKVLELFDGNKTQAANYLQISRNTIHNILNR